MNKDWAAWRHELFAKVQIRICPISRFFRSWIGTRPNCPEKANCHSRLLWTARGGLQLLDAQYLTSNLSKSLTQQFKNKRGWPTFSRKHQNENGYNLLNKDLINIEQHFRNEFFFHQDFSLFLLLKVHSRILSFFLAILRELSIVILNYD